MSNIVGVALFPMNIGEGIGVSLIVAVTEGLFVILGLDDELLDLDAD